MYPPNKGERRTAINLLWRTHV